MDDGAIRRKNEELRARQRRLAAAAKTATPQTPNALHAVSEILDRLERKPTVQSTLRCACGAEPDGREWLELPRAGPECVACEKTRREHEIERKRKRAEVERHWRIENAPELLRKAGVFAEHAEARLTDFPDSVQASVRAFIDDVRRHRGLLTTGGFGAGKTRLLAAIGREFVIENRSLTYALVRSLLRRIWSTYRESASETEEEVVAELCRIEVLLIDDLGHEGRVSPAVVGTLHEIVSARNGNFLPTVVTTNLTLAEIQVEYGGAIASRLAAWLPVVVTGPDRRRAEEA